MIELRNDRLSYSFPDVHRDANLEIEFQRTLRIPDDERTYPLPPGLGAFPIRVVDDYADRLPAGWRRHGGVVLPMHQSEALWIRFLPHYDRARASAYPFAVKVGAGKVNAVTGEPWTDGLQARPQAHIVASLQPWLDGFCVEKGVIRQFVAMPLGAGYSAEEQLTGAAEHGGLQIEVFPMKRAAFERRFPKRPHAGRAVFLAAPGADYSMGLAPGGRMRQELYEDPFEFDDWDLTHSARCFVHIANTLVWRSITESAPPSPPPTAAEYTRHGLPWFEYYDEDAVALEGSDKLASLKSVAAKGAEDGLTPLLENEPVVPGHVVVMGGAVVVRQGEI